VTSFGAIDLFAGSSSISGSNLWQTDKDPLNQIDEGVEDVIGKQASSLGGGITQIVDELINSILGFPLLGPPQGGPNELYTFFGNILTFLGDLDPLDPNFLANIGTSASNFITDILHPTNLLAPLVSDPLQGLGLVGVVPIENLAIDAILAGVESVQSLIDAILKTVIPGYVPGSGMVDDIFIYFENLLKMFTNVDLTDPNWYLDLASTAFDPLAAVVQFITSMLLTALNPLDPGGLTHLLAPLVPIGSAGGDFPVLGHVPMANLALDLISGYVEDLIGNAQEVIDAILSSLTGIVPIPGVGTPADIASYFTDIVKILGLPPLTTPGGALHLIPWGNVTGIADWGCDTIGDTAQSIADTVVHGIINQPAVPGVPPLPVGVDLGQLKSWLAEQSKYLGFMDPTYMPLGAQRWPQSIGALAQTHDAHLQNVSGNKPVFAGVDQSADPVFDFSTLTGTTIPTVPVKPGYSVIGMIGTPNIANKKSIEFYGGNTAGLTGLYVNLYQVDTRDTADGGGTTTWLHSSNNIVSVLRDLDGDPEAEIDTRVSSGMAWNYYNFPSGNIQTVSLGLPVQLPGDGTFQLMFNNYPTYAIPYNADRAAVQRALEVLTSVGTGNVYVYGPAGGPWTVCFRGALAYTIQPLMSFVQPTALPPGALPKVYDGLLTGQGAYYAVEMMVTGSGQYDIAGTHHAALPHHVANPKHFGARRAATTQPPPGSIVPDYGTAQTPVTAVPWFGLCGEPGQTQYTPTLITLDATGSFDPSLFLWANYFDVVICGGGGGGCAGAALNGGWGGQGGVWASKRVSRAGLAAGLWTFNSGAGGLGGKVTGTVGAAGNTSYIVIPGQANLTAAGGPGGFAPTGNPNFGAGVGPGDYIFNDFYGNPNVYYGGAGGYVANGNGGLPGGGGAGGNAMATLHDQFGGDGGRGGAYILAYM
jgi:hypothetical protein